MKNYYVNISQAMMVVLIAALLGWQMRVHADKMGKKHLEERIADKFKEIKRRKEVTKLERMFKMK